MKVEASAQRVSVAQPSDRLPAGRRAHGCLSGRRSGMGLIRFHGHNPKGGYDVHDGSYRQAASHLGVQAETQRGDFAGLERLIDINTV